MTGVQEINNPTQFNKATKNSRTAFKCFTIRKDKSTILFEKINQRNQIDYHTIGLDITSLVRPIHHSQAWHLSPITSVCSAGNSQSYLRIRGNRRQINGKFEKNNFRPSMNVWPNVGREMNSMTENREKVQSG